MRALVLLTAGVFALACSPAARAQGTARSLDIQPGARENALGAAGVALEADPADALWWNPAALGFARWHGATYTRVKLVPGLPADVIYQHAAVAGVVREGLGVGASGTFLTYGYGYDYFGYPSDEQDTEWSGAVGVGYRAWRDLAIGVTGKYVRLDYPTWPSVKGTAFAVDLGALYRQTFAPIRLGLGICVQNLGPEMEFGRSESSPLSRNLKVGGAVTLPLVAEPTGLESGLIAVYDYDHSLVTRRFHVSHTGLEFYGAYRRWFRLAGRYGYYSDPLGDIEDRTWGAGARLAGLSFDYAEIPQARDSGLPDVKKWTIGLHSDLLVEWLAAR